MHDVTILTQNEAKGACPPPMAAPMASFWVRIVTYLYCNNFKTDILVSKSVYSMASFIKKWGLGRELLVHTLINKNVSPKSDRCRYALYHVYR